MIVSDLQLIQFAFNAERYVLSLFSFPPPLTVGRIRLSRRVIYLVADLHELDTELKSYKECKYSLFMFLVGFLSRHFMHSLTYSKASEIVRK